MKRQAKQKGQTKVNWSVSTTSQSEADAEDKDNAPDSGATNVASIEEDSKDGVKPSNVDIIIKFEEYLEVRAPISDDEQEGLRKLDLEERWQLITSQERRPPSLAPRVYVDKLRSATNAVPKRASLRGKDATHQASYWLNKLKHDIAYSDDSFVLEFVVQGGVSVLVKNLKLVQKEQASLRSIRKSKASHLQSAMHEEYDCLLNIKYCLKSPNGVSQLLETRDAVEVVTTCIMSTSWQTSAAVLEILTLLCTKMNGFQQAMDALGVLRVRSGADVRYKLLVNMLNSHTSKHFQAVCVRFFNKIISCTESFNRKVHLQQELALAGLDLDNIDTRILSQGVDNEELQKELETWRKNYINVDSLQHDMWESSNRNSYLRQEVDRLQKDVKEREKKLSDLEKSKAEWKERSEKYRDRATEMQDLVAKISKLYTEKTGLDPEEEIMDLQDAYKPIDAYATVRGTSKFGSLRSQSNMSYTTLEVIPTPAPPGPPPEFLGQTMRKKVISNRINLPLLNWTPLHSVHRTLFESMNDEAKLREINFKPFEDIFKLQTKEESTASKARRERALTKISHQVHFVEPNRAKNMIITKRRTGLSSRDIKEAIDNYDISKLHGQYAELFLKYVPTKEELKQLAAHSKQYKDMAEAEQFLFQIAQVDRVEKKLTLMAFIGIFDELMNAVRPQIEDVYHSSESVINSIKLKKVFEIILAFGNYMNSGKRGYTLGFKLESLAKLSDVKSTDRKLTLLHYLVDYIEQHYTDFSDFYAELHITVEKGTSYQAISSDVHGLRKGIDLLKFEMEKQPGNKTLEAFYKRASVAVMDVGELFRAMEESYKSLCTLFGENYRDAEPDQLFHHIKTFIDNFKKASVANVERKAAAEAEVAKGEANTGATGDGKSPMKAKSASVGGDGQGPRSSRAPQLYRQPRIIQPENDVRYPLQAKVSRTQSLLAASKLPPSRPKLPSSPSVSSPPPVPSSSSPAPSSSSATTTAAAATAAAARDAGDDGEPLGKYVTKITVSDVEQVTYETNRGSGLMRTDSDAMSRKSETEGGQPQPQPKINGYGSASQQDTDSPLMDRYRLTNGVLKSQDSFSKVYPAKREDSARSDTRPLARAGSSASSSPSTSLKRTPSAPVTPFSPSSSAGPRVRPGSPRPGATSSPFSPSSAAGPRVRPGSPRPGAASSRQRFFPAGAHPHPLTPTPSVGSNSSPTSSLSSSVSSLHGHNTNRNVYELVADSGSERRNPSQPSRNGSDPPPNPTRQSNGQPRVFGQVPTSPTSPANAPLKDVSRTSGSDADGAGAARPSSLQTDPSMRSLSPDSRGVRSPGSESGYNIQVDEALAMLNDIIGEEEVSGGAVAEETEDSAL